MLAGRRSPGGQQGWKNDETEEEGRHLKGKIGTPIYKIKLRLQLCLGLRPA